MKQACVTRLTRRGLVAGAALALPASSAALPSLIAASVSKTAAPYSMIGTFGAWQKDQLVKPFGTVWVSNPGRIATAAHVIGIARNYFDRAGGHLSVEVRLGCLPTGAASNRIRVSKEQLHCYDENEIKYGLIKPEHDVGCIAASVTMPGLISADVCAEPTIEIELAGYPSDGAISDGIERDGRALVRDSSKAHHGVQRPQFYFYDADAAEGQSGAPVMRQTADGRWQAIAVHNGKNPEAYLDSGLMQGVWINEDITRFLRG